MNNNNNVRAAVSGEEALDSDTQTLWWLVKWGQDVCHQMSPHWRPRHQRAGGNTRAGAGIKSQVARWSLASPESGQPLLLSRLSDITDRDERQRLCPTSCPWPVDDLMRVGLWETKPSSQPEPYRALSEQTVEETWHWWHCPGLGWHPPPLLLARINA